jgi:hypothetical protein
MLQLDLRLQNRRGISFILSVPHPKPTQNISPSQIIILGIHPHLHLFVINHAHPERFLRLGRRCYCQFARSSPRRVKDVFGFEGLELEPFGDVVSEVLHLDFDQGKRSLEGVVGEMG